MAENQKDVQKDAYDTLCGKPNQSYISEHEDSNGR